MMKERRSEAPASMAHRSDNFDSLRSVGDPLDDEDTSGKSTAATEGICEAGEGEAEGEDEPGGDLPVTDEDGDLPQCKIKRNYSCNLCPFFSQNPRLFLYHSRDVHFDKIKIFECSQCLYASKHSQKLQRHINMIHVAGKTRIKRSQRLAKGSEKRKDSKGAKGRSPENLIAEGSEQGTLSSSVPENLPKTDAENVSPTEDGVGGELKCSLCDFKSKNQKLVRRHEKIVHLKKRFLRCSKCSYVTHVKARYTKHVKYHTMPMIKCDLCDFRTPYKWNLDRHYKNHSGLGAFQCSKCNFRADIKQSLTVHEMNHHVPPVGQGAVTARRKNKVGASEAGGRLEEASAGEKLEPLHRSSSEPNENENSMQEGSAEKISGLESLRNVKLPYNNKRESANNSHLQTDFIHPDDIVPRYGQIYVKNLKCKFCSYKAVFSHEIWRHEKRIHGYIRPENKKENVPKRPPPKLIPIQNKTGSVSPAPSPILKIPAVRNKTSVQLLESTSADKTVNEKEFTEMCKKSCLTSSLKDFVSLIGDEEGLKTIPDSSTEVLEAESSGWMSQVEDTKDAGSDFTKRKQTDLLKKKNASFFDRLKEKLMTGTSEEQSLFCESCGHESKCLSEAVAHQKRHSSTSRRGDSDCHPESEFVLSGTELSSTRCQHCRQRCKTSTDLINHLKSCKAFGAAYESQSSSLEEKVKVEEDTFENDEKDDEDGKPMENRVFVWNDLGLGREEEDEPEDLEMDVLSNDEYAEESVPMYGTVTSRGSDNTEYGTLVMEIDPRLNLTVKEVFKCPHCSFWASTASRFHVHIVGHLNKKPFECSLCLYRSNWRWDITKHIRLKSARDPSHLEAKVNMTDETGRRNYSKYNKYLTMMKVQEPTAQSSGTGRRSRPTEPTQGNVTDKDILPLPAPPRLTRAPAPGISHQMPQGLPLRPPPPLKAAHQIPSQVKLQQNGSRPTKDTTKKTLWKCKKCNYRNSNKNSVLAHVKEHYGKKKENLRQLSVGEDPEGETKTVGLPVDSLTSRDLRPPPTKNQAKTPTYKCGHCHQVSNWKHVIQRHCRLKHNGDALIQVGWKEGATGQLGESSQSLQRPEESVESISCDICPFTTDSEGDLTAHKLNHVDRPGSIFKCSYCPFYVPSKIAVLEHMEIHGVDDGCDLTSLKVDNFDPSECNDEFSTHNNGFADLSKRYKCRQCPYLSNSRTQFLYHKQFHRPRNAPFKCMYCSYNVSRRHLLHQHLRVHHKQNQTPSSLVERSNTRSNEPLLPAFDAANTTGLAEIPLVWVFKTGSFYKMFKCRWCPHVNVRKINIQEHEKMHRLGEIKNETEAAGPLGVKLRCPECNYTCNNPGVLASHVKVHQGLFGEVKCLVDPSRSDSDQIKELQKTLQSAKPKVTTEMEFKDEAERTLQDEPLSSQPENAYSHSNKEGENSADVEEDKKVISFCHKCPARFFFKKELRIHSKFHMIHLPFRCQHCSYTARQRPHLLAHYKVHSQEYQERTAGLVGSYSVSPDCPQPETEVISRDSLAVEGPVWAVASTDNLGQKKPQGRAFPRHACPRCPAKFFKSVALQYHLTLHGATHQHKCKYCDYTVKTYGNLIKHQLVHSNELKEKRCKTLKFSYSFPIFGEKLLKRASEDQNLIKNDSLKCGPVDEEPSGNSNSQFESFMLGSPNFIYPTYLKNGKLRQKKYKCHKCPSAFEKRDQYRIHLSLHGSKQKYSCENCDYSVKYYANYVQHMRKHQTHEEAVKAKEAERITSSVKVFNDKSTKPSGVEEHKLLYELTLLEQQTLLLQDRRKSSEGREEDKKSYCCCRCPYVSNRRDAVDNHARRHFRVSGVKSGFECSHCDYSATQGNFLREHNKLHFNAANRYKPEAFLKCEKMEIWCCEDQAIRDSSFLLFQDRGEEEENRFLPSLGTSDLEDEKEDEWKIYVDSESGELVGEESKSTDCHDFSTFENSGSTDELLYSEDLIEMVEEPSDETPDSILDGKAKPKSRRWRGKNWKCKKCPHAFGKRDQYLRHVALHGSNQRHSCDICDYSVKFYTNYVQHMRMHQTHEPDRVIFVKDNLQSLEDTATKQKDCDQPSPEISRTTEDDSDSCPSLEDKPLQIDDTGPPSLTPTTDGSPDEERPLEIAVSQDDAPLQCVHSPGP